ncbi:MAG: DUF2336 domain-containing protein [Rhodospirillales bacterium]|nr:DUF2336 domain-containing protein [Rhodospirillales bacterium]
MVKFLDKFFGKTPKSYEEQREALASANVKERLSLASNSKTNKEILYYLAEKDPSPKVRKAVAENEAMPVQVSTVLADDDDSDVRLALAGRLVDLLPGASQDQQSQLYAFVVQALGTLALDEVLKIRVALSSTLKDHAHTPPKIAGQLARDVEQQVSEPILRFCSALSDTDLLDILKSHPASWVIEAIASRDSVSEELSEAVVETRDSYGGSALIGNDGRCSRIICCTGLSRSPVPCRNGKSRWRCARLYRCRLRGIWRSLSMPLCVIYCSSVVILTKIRRKNWRRCFAGAWILLMMERMKRPMISWRG